MINVAAIVLASFATYGLLRVNAASLDIFKKRLVTREKRKMLWTILVVLLVIWLIGLLARIGGSLIHLMLVIALIILVIQLVTGRRI